MHLLLVASAPYTATIKRRGAAVRHGAASARCCCPHEPPTVLNHRDSHAHAEDLCDTDHRLVLPFVADKGVTLRIPESRRARVETSALLLLHDRDIHNVLEVLREVRQAL